MGRPRLTLLLIFLVALVPVCAHPRTGEPQVSGAPPTLPLFSRAGWQALGARHPDFRPGAWATYRLEVPGKPPATLRIASVPPAPPIQLAVELRHQSDDGPPVWIKLGLGAEHDGVRPLLALLVQVPGMPPLPVPVADGTLSDSTPLGAWDPAAGGRPEGDETLTTPLGPRAVRRVQSLPRVPGEAAPMFWLDRTGEIPLFGLVQGHHADQRLILVGFGSDAQAELPALTVGLPGGPGPGALPAP